MPMNDRDLPEFERESVELHAVVVTDKRTGTQVTEGVEFAITGLDERPSAWRPAVVSGGATKVLIEGLEPGTYLVWVRIEAPPERPVRRVGKIYIR